VTREDLPLAAQAVQSAHAAVEYAARFPDVAGGTLVMLAVPDEPSLHQVTAKLELFGVTVVQFREPDLGGALTAVSAAGPAAARRLARLPLLLREEVNDGREHVVAPDEGRRAG